jgi:putative oxidoreductase
MDIDSTLVLRLICGGFLIPHTIAKLGHIERSSAFFEKIGFRPAKFFVVLTSALEVVAAFGLITGLYPRVAALIGATILLVAAWAIAKIHGLKWRWQYPGIEYMVFWACIFLYAGFLA